MQTTIHTEVIASVAQPEQVISNVSNTFAFVFDVDQVHVNSKERKLNSLQTVKRVLPATDEEAHKIFERVHTGT